MHSIWQLDQRIEVYHARAVSPGDESVINSSSVRITYHLPRVIDTIRNTFSTAQRAKVSHIHSIGLGNESMCKPFSTIRNTCRLAGVVNADSAAIAPI